MKSATRVALVAVASLVILLGSAAPALAKAKDRNRNKIPDTWEKKYHLSTRKSQAKLDFDKDGLSNINEYLAGTSPRLKDTNRNGVRDGLEDRDRDGLVNLAELKAKTNLTVKDTDRDGVIDSLEDPDADVLTNAQEWKTGTHPLIADTDGNGIDDGEEDADEDGLNNAQEFECGTDPLKEDSDGDGDLDFDEDADMDGVGNGTEYEEGTDPRDADSDDDGVNDGDEIRGSIDSFDAVTGLLTIVSLRGVSATTSTFTVDGTTILKWDEGGDVPPTLDDLVYGIEIREMEAALQPDGSRLATEITIVADLAVDPDVVEITSEIVSWDAETGVLTVFDLADESAPYEVLVDDTTLLEWADGSPEVGTDDLVAGASISVLDLTEDADFALHADRIVLVPLTEVPAE